MNILANGANNATQATEANNHVTLQQPQQTQGTSTVQSLIDSAPTVSQLPENQRYQQVAQRPVNSAAFGNYREAGASAVPQAGPSKQSVNNYSVQGVEVPQTVKMFQTKFMGSNGCVIGHSIGDSGSEVTLLREDMRTLLGLEGKKCKLQMQWIDGSKKYVDATRVDLEVQGVLIDSPKLLLRNCYAISDLNLASRSLNMNLLKDNFSYLKDVEFESYSNVSPCLLIGSCHASVIESVDKLLEGCENDPVALKTKLGWTVYGGCSSESKLSKNVGHISKLVVHEARRKKLPLVYLSSRAWKRKNFGRYNSHVSERVRSEKLNEFCALSTGNAFKVVEKPNVKPHVKFKDKIK
jgi:hypothetical protein